MVNAKRGTRNGDMAARPRRRPTCDRRVVRTDKRYQGVAVLPSDPDRSAGCHTLTHDTPIRCWSLRETGRRSRERWLLAAARRPAGRCSVLRADSGAVHRVGTRHARSRRRPFASARSIRRRPDAGSRLRDRAPRARHAPSRAAARMAALRRRRPRAGRGLVVYTGGPESPLRFAFCALPFLVAFVASPRRLALWSLSMIACFVVIRHGLPVPRDARYEGPTLAETTGLAFALLAPMAISAVLRRLHGAAGITLPSPRRWPRTSCARRIASGASSRMRCTPAPSRRSPRVRARSLPRCAATTPAWRPRVRRWTPRSASCVARSSTSTRTFSTTRIWRRRRATRRPAAERGGFSTTVEVDPAAIDVDDLTVMSVLRELLSNVVKHAGADHVDVRVINEAGSCLVVVVRDDGRGFTLRHPSRRYRRSISAWFRRPSACVRSEDRSIFERPGTGPSRAPASRSPGPRSRAAVPDMCESRRWCNGPRIVG